jgi:DNA-directed RNA polymerase subunit M/transcription elongation factor TFIIS
MVPSKDKLNNCEKCGNSYEKYIDKNGKEDVTAYLSVMSVGEWKEGVLTPKPAKGVCPFCNPKSVYYLKK